MGGPVWRSLGPGREIETKILAFGVPLYMVPGNVFPRGLCPLTSRALNPPPTPCGCESAASRAPSAHFLLTFPGRARWGGAATKEVGPLLTHPPPRRGGCTP